MADVSITVSADSSGVSAGLAKVQSSVNDFKKQSDSVALFIEENRFIASVNRKESLNDL